MSKPTRLVFFGNERLATGVSTRAPTLRALVEADYEVCAVVSNYSEGVSRNKHPLEIAEVAEQYDIPVLVPEKLADIADKLADFKAEAAVLVAYGNIIPQSIINIFPRGIINIHPSLLPKYRGPTPVESAILDGVDSTGVSLMGLAAKMDAGPVFAQTTVDLSGQETKPELADKLLAIGCELLIKNLAQILDESLKPTLQDDSQASYTQKISKQDGLITFNEPAEVIERKVRAFLGFPKAHATVLSQDVVITKARIAKDANDGVLVQATRPGFIEIEQLIGPSGRTMSGADFIRGYGN